MQKNHYNLFLSLKTKHLKPHSLMDKMGVGGNTSPEKMILYVENAWENPYDNIQRIFRRNGKMISHELLYWLLMAEGRGERVALRNDDYSGHKAGTELNFWTAEVHDRDIEKNLMTLNFLYYMREAHHKVQYTISVLNERDLFSSFVM